jgi:hypothetical protein
MKSDFAATVMVPVVLRLMLAPPAGAGPLRVTVHVAPAPGLNEAGLQATELTVGGMLICAPVAVMGIADPWGLDATGLLTPMGIAPVPETVTEPVATTPLAMVFWFEPVATHSKPLAAVAHVNDFPAAVNAGPAMIERLVTLCG